MSGVLQVAGSERAKPKVGTVRCAFREIYFVTHDHGTMCRSVAYTPDREGFVAPAVCLQVAAARKY
jgi:hypothetical protein